MSSIIGGALCQALYQSLSELAGNANPLVKRTRTGMVDGLLSPLNTSGQTGIKVDQMDGHRRAVKVQYYQRNVIGDVLSAVPADCASEDEFTLQETDFDVALFSLVNKVVDENYVAQICEGQGAVTNMMLAGMFNAMQEKINANLLTTAATKFGINNGNSPATNAQITHDIYNNSTGAVNMQVVNTFGNEIVNLNQVNGGKPIIVSGATMWSASNSLKVSCCNDAGIDLGMVSAASPWYFFNDQQSDTILGAGESVVMEPGAAQLVTYYKYRSLGNVMKTTGALAGFELSDGTLRGLITDPQPGGLTYNLRIFPDTCGETFTIEMSLAYDLWTLPTDMYKTGDTLEGVNGLFDYKFT